MEPKMAKSISISLGPHFDEFIAQQLKSGRYGSASEVVRTGLRLLEEAEARRQHLRQLLIDGEQSGFVHYDYNALMEELDKEAH
jgi:antitoxin ParD1/3/4